MPNEKNEAVSVDDQLAEMEANLAAEMEAEENEDTKDDQTSETESPTSEEKATEEEPQAEDAKPEQESSDEVDISQLSEKAQKRYRQMAQRIKELESSQVDYTKPEPKVEAEFDYEKATGLPWDTTKEITKFEYEQQVAKTAENVVKQTLAEERRLEAEQKIKQNLLQDIDKVKDKYPEFEDKPWANDAVEWYRNTFETYKSQGKYYSFVNYIDNLMGIKSEGEQEGKEQVRSKVKKQAAEQAIPAGSGEQTREITYQDLLENAQSPDDLEKLEAEINRASKQS